MADGILDSISKFTADFSATIKSVAKLMLNSRRTTVSRSPECGRPLLVLGNGPSLRDNLRDDMEILRSTPALAVNFFANAPEYTVVRPRYYVLADPHFFMAYATDKNVERLWENLRSTSWEMILFIPAQFRRKVPCALAPAVRIEYFNFVAMEGFGWFERMVWRNGRGMPRPRNVLIPSLMISLAMGFRDIHILGADHTWTRTLSVTDDNTVVSVQPHFYADNAGEKERVSSVYAGVRLHDVLESMVIAFRSYHSIAGYARSLGANIYNSTPGSMIDAFVRRPLPSI